MTTAPPPSDDTPATGPKRALPWKRLAMLTAKVLVVLAMAWGVRATVLVALQELSLQAWRPDSLRVGWLLAACWFYCAGLWPPAVFWHRLLTAMGQRPGLWETIRAYCIGHLGKYVPGKAMVVLLRVGLIRSARVSMAVASASVFFETLSMMAVGAALAAVLLVALGHDSTALIWLSVGAAIALGLPTQPALFYRALKAAGISRFDPQAVAQIARLNYRTLLPGWLRLAAGWLLNGLSLWATLRGAGFSSTLGAAHEIALCTAAAALAVVAGFLSFIPGGFGVREMVLLPLLAPVFSEAGALVAAILLRLEWLVSELLVSSILYWGVRGGDQAKCPVPAPSATGRDGPA